MGQVDTEDCAGGSAGAYVFRSCPNRSLTRARERLIFWSLALLCSATAVAFALLGYWLILPFVGLEIGMLAWAFMALRSHEDDYEVLTIDGDVVVLERHTGTRTERRQFNRQWVRVVCDCGTPGRNCRLSVCSHGRESEVGRYLSDEGRLELAAILRRKLQA